MFRGLAILVGLLPIVACELILIAVDLGRPEQDTDPFVGFSEVRPLFVLNESGDRYEIPPAQFKFFRPESFAARKAPGAFRIVCLGGSTVQGRPFQVETSLTTWLELSLEAADPTQRWEVVNCGGVSYASYRLVPILREMLDHHEPDLIILYTGHNEFLEDRTYRHVKRIPRLVRRAMGPASRLRTFQMLRSLAADPDRRPADLERTVLGPEVDARLDSRGGLEDYHRDDRWRAGVIDHFAFNVERMVRMAQEHDVPLLLANPVVNLETPPFKAEHRAGLSDAEKHRFRELWTDARRHYDNLYRAIDSLEQAAAIDDRHAGLQYTLGTCYQQLGQWTKARAALIRAKDEDICPLRILEPMRADLRRIADRMEVPLVEFQSLFARRSEGGITGDQWLVDHVHPTILGHQVIARRLLDEMVRMGFLRPADDWEAMRDRRYREHYATLDDMYFLIGERRLDALRGWAAGRSKGIRRPDPVENGSSPPAEK